MALRPDKNIIQPANQTPSSQMALRPDSNTIQPGNQSHKYESLQQPGRVYYPARRDFHSDPEDYIRQVQKYVTDPIIAIPPAGQSGPFSYQYMPPNHRVIPWPSRSPYLAMQNSAKPVSDDARVLEMQEAASRVVARDTNNLAVPLHQQPGNASCGNLLGSGLRDSSLHSATSPIFLQQAASYPLDKDPAVISVGIKTRSGINGDHHAHADTYHRLNPGNEGSQAIPIQEYHSSKQQPSVPITSDISEKDSLTEPEIAANAHRAYERNTNIKAAVVEEPAILVGKPVYGANSLIQNCDQDRGPSLQKKLWDTRVNLINGSDSMSEISSRSQRSFQDDYQKNQPATNKNTLWVGGLCPRTTQSQLEQIFEPFGEILRISHVFTREQEGAYAFVTYVQLAFLQ
jgi:hypothetical protein